MLGTDTRFKIIDVDPVFPVVSVATTVIVLLPPERLYSVFVHVQLPRFAITPFTVTLVIHPVSDTVPESVGNPVTILLLA